MYLLEPTPIHKNHHQQKCFELSGLRDKTSAHNYTCVEHSTHMHTYYIRGHTLTSRTSHKYSTVHTHCSSSFSLELHSLPHAYFLTPRYFLLCCASLPSDSLPDSLLFRNGALGLHMSLLPTVPAYRIVLLALFFLCPTSLPINEFLFSFL